MRVLAKFLIDCDADATWRALHSPAVLAEVSGPFMSIDPLDPLPVRWEPGDEAGVQLRTGPIAIGKQLIHISDSERDDRGRPVRIMRDSGIPLSGPLSVLDVWDHQIAVSEAPGDPRRTLWRERLVIGGKAAPLLWPALWTAWQLRRFRIQSLAKTWAYDPEPTAD